MNFIPLPNFGTSNDRLTTNTLNSNKSEVNDITSSIVDSFENGTFYESHALQLQQYFKIDIKQELDDLLSKLDSEWVPRMKDEARKCDKKTLEQCIFKIMLIRQRFGEVQKFLRNFKNRKEADSQRFICKVCEQVIVLPTNSNLWVGLLEHEHVEKALAYGMENCNICNDEISEESMQHLQSVLNLTEATMEVNSNKFDITPVNDVNTAGAKQLNACCLLASIQSNFTFNFEIKYDTRIEQQLYYPKFVKDVQLIDSLGMPTFQFKSKTPNLFTCLICCCEIPTYATARLIKEHVQGHRHAKRKANLKVLKAFCAYHRHWMQEEPKYQAHQIHFIPNNEVSALCILCDQVMVPYDMMEMHIKEGLHKEKFFELTNKRSKLRLLNLQGEVYNNSEDDCSNNGSIISSEDVTNGETDSYIEEPSDDDKPRAFKACSADIYISDDDVLLNSSIVIERSDSVSQMENLKLNVDQQTKVGSPVKKSIESINLPSSSKMSPEVKTLKEIKNMESQQNKSSTEEGNKSKSKFKNHAIVKSVLNEDGTELEDLLENRLLPHLKSLHKLDDKHFECKSCNVRVQNDIIFVRDHICSKAHQAKTDVLNVVYQFHCEICNTMLKDNNSWKGHMRMSKHIERCDKLGASRKTKLTEYECKTCRLVIFGDELSLKRHTGSFGKNAWPTKIKDITLPPEVKGLLRSEHFIMEKCFYLVREANKVLLEDEAVRRCCAALQAALVVSYPKCKAYPFGSRVSGLGSERSDLDIFMDVGDMYMGNKSQDPRSQEKFVNSSYKAFRKRKDEFIRLNAIPTARTPIVQVFHNPTKLDCDLSFRHGLSVENTKFLKLCIEVQPVMQPLILILKQWMDYSKLQEHITTYALSMMVIFYLQFMDYLLPVHELRQLGGCNVLVIDGWSVVDFSNVTAAIRESVKPYMGPMKELLKGFFGFYGNFSFVTDIICPLLGRPIKKSLFLIQPNGTDLPLEMLAYVQKVSTAAEPEYFRARSPFCIQDPFDLSHNLVKACTSTAVDRLKRLCELTYKHLNTIQ